MQYCGSIRDSFSIGQKINIFIFYHRKAMSKIHNEVVGTLYTLGGTTCFFGWLQLFLDWTFA